MECLTHTPTPTPTQAHTHSVSSANSSAFLLLPSLPPTHTPILQLVVYTIKNQIEKSFGTMLMLPFLPNVWVNISI